MLFKENIIKKEEEEKTQKIRRNRQKYLKKRPF